LNVQHEDHVFHIVREAVRRAPTAEHAVKLWQTVRFGQLSCCTLLEASQIEEIPKELFVFLAVEQVRQPALVLPADPMKTYKGLEEPWTSPLHFQPRKYLRLKVAYLHAVECRDSLDAEYMRNKFQGRQICSRLEAIGCSTMKMNITRQMKLTALHEFDVAVIGDVYDPTSVHASVPEVVSAFARRNKGIVIWDSGLNGGVFEHLSLFDIGNSRARITKTEDDLTLLLEMKEHRVFRCIEASPHIILRSGKSKRAVDLEEGVQVLARWSDGTPHIVKRSEDRVIRFLSPRDFRDISVQEQQLLINAVACVGSVA